MSQPSFSFTCTSTAGAGSSAGVSCRVKLPCYFVNIHVCYVTHSDSLQTLQITCTSTTGCTTTSTAGGGTSLIVCGAVKEFFCLVKAMK